MQKNWRTTDALIERAEEIFCAALGIASIPERTAFVEASCAGNSGLRAAVNEMLSLQSAADSFFERSKPAVPDISQVVTAVVGGVPDEVDKPANEVAQEGAAIGRYELLQKIGEGGCGIVYLAEQRSPVRRQVALKVIKLGMDTRRVIARFEAERQALALMDHPNIARVLDAGATQRGCPYFVMELVRGVKLTKYCDEQRLDLQQRLALFIQVCNAIQHAHQKGIVHRDVKPSNILVTNQDGAPVPKVIDFGVAKATLGQWLADETFTAHGQFVGTPAYMSPEQAQLSNLDVDTRSDIYSLGVLLYEILTGKTPFDQAALLRAGFDAMRRTLREREPDRPSIKLGGLRDAELTQTAMQRRMEPRRLKSLLTGDLDWIVMKALEKDRVLRYQTAHGLALDVQRYLNNEPVVARPPSRCYRFRKLVCRNQMLFAMIGAVSLALILGFGISSWLFVKEREARRQQALLREKAESASASELRRRIEAEANAKIAQAAVLITRRELAAADRLAEEVQVSLLHPSIEGASVFRDLGHWNVAQGRWKQAADLFRKQLQLVNQVDQTDLSDNATRHLPAAATTLIVTGDRAGYRRLIQESALRFSKSDHPVAAEQILKSSSIVPLEAGTLALLEPLKRIAVNSLANEPAASNENRCMLAWRALALSMFDYRCGNFSQAGDWARRCLAYGDNPPSQSAIAHAVSALAAHRLNPAEGRVELEAARALIEPRFPDYAVAVGAITNDVSGFWNDWIVALLLYQEAHRQIHP